MKKSLILSTFLLLCAVWVSAQTGSSSTQPSSQSPTSSQPSTSSQTSSSDSSGQTIEGCLGGAAGNFTLTSSSGTTYQLAGDTSKLSDHVGQQVEITGTAASGGAGTSPSSATSPSSSAGGSMGGGQTINVTKVKKIASTCSTSK